MTIYEEFMLLREFEKTENDLESKLIKRKEEYLEMQTKLADAQLKIDNKRKDIEKFDEQYKQLAHTFTQMIHDETKYSDFLARVYKRKIKRKKKTEGQEDDEGKSKVNTKINNNRFQRFYSKIGCRVRRRIDRIGYGR